MIYQENISFNNKDWYTISWNNIDFNAFKLNIIYDDLIDYKEIEKFINEYCKPFNLEKKEKIE